MCNENQIKSAIEVLATEVAKADNMTDAILNVQDKIVAEVDNIKTSPWWTVFTYAKYATVQAKDEADARDRGQRKLNRLFPGQRNLIIGCICKFLAGNPPATATEGIVVASETQDTGSPVA